MTSNSDMNNGPNGRRGRPMSRWLIGTGIALVACAALIPAIADLLPVEGLGYYLTGRTPPYHFRIVPAHEEPGHVDVASVVVVVGIALSIAGLAVRARERRTGC